MTDRCPVLGIEGSVTSTSRQEHRDEREAHQSAAPAHDRRHDRAQFRREDAQRLYPPRQDFHGLPRPLAEYGNALASSPRSSASDSERGASTDHQRFGCSAAFLLHYNGRAGKYGSAPYVRARGAHDGGGLVARREWTPAACTTRPPQ